MILNTTKEESVPNLHKAAMLLVVLLPDIVLAWHH